jgi:hypothetical protein
MMLNINDPTLTKLLLEHLVEQAEDGNLDNLLAKGLRPELVDDLRQRPLRDFYHATRHGGLNIAIQIDIPKLEACLWRHDVARQTETLKEYFIRNSASLDLLRTHFTLSKQELQRLRTELALTKAGPNGRPRMPPAAVRDKIHVRWHDICLANPDTHDRERLALLHMDFTAFSLTALHRVITEFDGPAAATSTPTQAPVAVPPRVPTQPQPARS